MLLSIMIGKADSQFTPEIYGELARDNCEEREMRADCLAVRESVFRTLVPALQEFGVSMPGISAGRQARSKEEVCLAGYGLAPEEEDRFANR